MVQVYQSQLPNGFYYYIVLGICSSTTILHLYLKLLLKIGGGKFE